LENKGQKASNSSIIKACKNALSLLWSKKHKFHQYSRLGVLWKKKVFDRTIFGSVALTEPVKVLHSSWKTIKGFVQ
jgi:hypothetical protein